MTLKMGGELKTSKWRIPWGMHITTDQSIHNIEIRNLVPAQFKVTTLIMVLMYSTMAVTII